MKKIRTAIIGLGNIAHGYEDVLARKQRLKYPTHLSAIKGNKNFKLVAACDHNASARKAFSKKISESVTLYSDCQRMFLLEELDLIVVASPTETHVAICRQAIKAGAKNIFCEKPLSYSLTEARALVNYAKQKRVKLAVNYFRLYDKTYQKLITDIKKKKFGSLKSATVYYSKGIFNTATHAISLFEKMFGTAQRVTGQKIVLPGSDPTINFLIKFKNAEVLFVGDTTNKSYLKMKFDFVDKNIIIDRDNSKDINVNIKNSMRDVYQNIYNYITKGSAPACDSQEAIQAMYVAEKAVKSLKNNKPLSI